MQGNTDTFEDDFPFTQEEVDGMSKGLALLSERFAAIDLANPTIPEPELFDCLSRVASLTEGAFWALDRTLWPAPSTKRI